MILRGARVSNLDDTARGTVERAYPDGKGGIEWLIVLWDEALLTNAKGVRVHVSQVLEVVA